MLGSRIKGELHRVGVNCYRRRPNEHTCIKIYSISGEFRRCRFVFFVVCAPDTPVLHRPQKKSEKPIFRTNPRLEAHLPPFFLRMTFRNSAITRASPLIKKSTTLQSSLCCSHCSVAKRQQFSCPLGTAIFVAEVGKCGSRLLDTGYVFLVLWPSVFFTAPLSMSRTRTYEYFKKISYTRCNVFF